MSDEEFFDNSTEASEIKIRIVTKYFRFWAKVISGLVKDKGRQMAYYDLFSGPGRYDDGSKSTPILVLEAALENELVANQLITVFNDVDSNYAKNLAENIGNIPDIKNLRYKPKVINTDALSAYNQIIGPLGKIPSFTFIDPFGYKDVTQNLLENVLRGWGCDLLLFFNYNRINAAITNEVFDEHMSNLFGKTRLDDLRTRVKGRAPHERVKIVLDSFAQALKEKGFEYVLPFEFSKSDMRKISHHLVFVTKSVFAYGVMKEIMAQESSEEIHGVASFKYTNSLTKDETPLLYLLARPIADLGEMLLSDFSGQTITCKEIYQQHHVGKQFILKNYKAALLHLEEEGKVSTEPPAEKRRIIKGKRTFADGVKVKFPD